MPPLQQPDPEKLSAARATAVFKRLGLEWATDPLLLIQPIPRMVPLLPTGGTEWWVGDHVVVSYQGKPEDFPHKGPWASDDARGVPAHSAAVATAILVLAWNDPKLRPLFDLPAWALDLEALTGGGAVDVERPQGFVRYTLLPGGPDARALPVKRELVRLSRRDGRPLRPHIIEPGEDLTLRAAGLTAADLAFHRAASAMDRLPPDDPLAANFAAEAFEHLLAVDDLTGPDGQVVIPLATPFEPVIQAVDGDECIELSWQEPVLDSYAVGPGYVLTAEDQLRPLGTPALAADPSLLQHALPRVPFAEAQAFVERFVRHSAVGLELDSDHLPRSRPPERIVGCVRLGEVDDALVVDLTSGYEVGGELEEIPLDERASHRRVAGALVRRDRATERRLRDILVARLGRPVPARLRGDAALDFLTDGAQVLGPEFVFFGTEDLTRHRVVGAFKAKVGVPSGVDWLDLRIDFEVDGRTVSGAAVLASWRAGHRYHRLPDGTLARLPDEWLAQHGQAAAELEDIRAAGDGQLSIFAAPLVEQLLDQVDDPSALRWREALEQLHDIDKVPDRPVPTGLNAELRSYQHTGFRWLAFLRDVGLHGVLADDMGLGKTLQAITLLLDTHHPADGPAKGGASLVVAPTSVVHNWRAEIERFAPQLKVLVHHGIDRDPAALEEAEIVITSYALMRGDLALLGSRQWRVLVLDEAHHIKNPDSQVAKAARGIPADYRVALTGTPLENHLIELWSIFQFLMPGFFGSRAGFTRRYAQPIQRDNDQRALEALRRRLKPFVLRRHKSEVAQELPPRQEQVLYCELGPEQRKLYEQVKATFRDAVLGRVDREGLGAATLSVLEALMRLRQVCCDPALLPYPEAAEVGASAKTDLLLELLAEIIDAGHRTLVFSQWPTLLKRVRRHTDTRGWSSLYLDGGTTRRHDLVDAFNAPDGPPLFFISLKAGGTGLNLTGADHVIHLDPWWNPAVEDQATDRAHRIGQTRPVVAYKLVAKDTVEEKILELQARKRALFEATVERDRVVVEQLTRADLEAVFALDAPVAPLGPPGDVPVAELMVEPEIPEAPELVPEVAGGSAVLGALPNPIARQLRAGEVLTNASVRDLMGWSSAEARRWLREQVDAGLLEQRGRKRGTHYVAGRG
ncbi:MAG: SNF2 helicase associated domain-containing protein [Myxococcales bacterium]|nr:SNF2 helicase associated domain-containing protein [Myxococcales bacterium]